MMPQLFLNDEGVSFILPFSFSPYLLLTNSPTATHCRGELACPSDRWVE
jgi:hypothetical protein